MANGVAVQSKPMVSLVLGAGVSTGLVPRWGDLTNQVESKCGAAPGALAGMPNEFQLRLELAWRTLRARCVNDKEFLEKFKRNGDAIGARMLAFEREVEREWVAILRACLYSDPEANALRTTPTSVEGGRFATKPSTLDAIVRTLIDDNRAPQIQRVITFNADDWLEFALCRTLGRKAFHQRFRVVSQPTFGADVWVESPAEDEGESVAARKIPIIHAHGMLCHPSENVAGTASYATPNDQGREPSLDAPNMLVFRDLDYWKMTATPSSFANHVLMSALGFTRCVFVGLSMTDINLMRWLGTLAAESESAWHDRWHLHFVKGDESLEKGFVWLNPKTNRKRHRWLTAQPKSDSAAVPEALGFRGIETVTVDWGASPGAQNAVDTQLGKTFDP
jgi:hypothetical protein